ncbi:c-type cytochrome [Roseovarius sp.]|uniref:c-type cytochrome n=1 Tax=Roseovarius sp. TaxID=1486281 RepID=UPI003568861F
MKLTRTATMAFLALAAPAFAEGDAAEGERVFNNCKACHMLETPDGETIVRGGRVGPNLYGVIGSVAGSADFAYGNGLQDAQDADFVWTEEAVAAYVADPKAWLDEQGYATQSKMTYRLRKGGEDVAAYLATLSSADSDGS